MTRSTAVLTIFLMTVAFFAVSSAAARKLGGGGEWGPARQAVHVGNSVMVQLLRQMYLQQLGAGPPCGTHSSNGGCPP
ncbi:unnamed protein product [Alopecurus aequalis]